MSDCLFYKMASGEIKPDVIFENERILAFRDVNPQAPFHALIIPKDHISTLNDVSTQHSALLGELVLVAKQLAAEQGYDQSGYRLTINCNADGGQSVFHVHLHLMAGRAMSWPPG